CCACGPQLSPETGIWKRHLAFSISEQALAVRRLDQVLGAAGTDVGGTRAEYRFGQREHAETSLNWHAASAFDQPLKRPAEDISQGFRLATRRDTAPAATSGPGPFDAQLVSS